MKTLRIKFPTGHVGYELLYYMGVDWMDEKDSDQQALIGKCANGGMIELNKKEAQLLMWEVDNALDIKSDHLDHQDWNALQQYHLKRFSQKLYKFIKS